MTKIEAIIRSQHLDHVKAALDDIGTTRMTVTDVRGAGKQKGYTHYFRGAEYKVNLIQKTKIEIIAPDVEVAMIVEAIVAAARTGEIGDGKIFLHPVADTIRIRTGERGEGAV